MSTILSDVRSMPQTAPIHLSFHLAATLQVTGEEARRKVNRQIVPELGTGLIAREPELTIDSERVFWRVPIVLSLPNPGDLGQVGVVEVDARTGEVLIDSVARDVIIQHARRLYVGATLQTKQ